MQAFGRKGCTGVNCLSIQEERNAWGHPSVMRDANTHKITVASWGFLFMYLVNIQQQHTGKGIIFN